MNDDSKQITITIHKGSTSKSIPFRRGLGLQALRPPDAIDFDCRKADCGICIISVMAGLDSLSEKTPEEADFLKAMRAEPNERLACQCRVFGPVTFRVDDLLDEL